jgi:hypothetical protein
MAARNCSRQYLNVTSETSAWIWRRASQRRMLTAVRAVATTHNSPGGSVRAYHSSAVLLPDAPRFMLLAATDSRLAATHTTRDATIGARPLRDLCMLRTHERHTEGDHGGRHWRTRWQARHELCPAFVDARRGRRAAELRRRQAQRARLAGTPRGSELQRDRGAENRGCECGSVPHQARAQRHRADHPLQLWSAGGRTGV